MKHDFAPHTALLESPQDISPKRVAVVIPCYQVSRHILGVVAGIGPEVERIYVIDDGCPEGSGALVRQECADPRVQVLRHEANAGVGAAVMTGYCRALTDGMDIVVKLDGDGQMDATLLPRLIRPIVEGRADYAKGNRFYDLSHLGRMPLHRIVGNSILSFMAKLSTGYWGVFDPANGFTAISSRVLAHLPLAKISERYFFETDMLFRLNTLRAVVADVPMAARYGTEKSNLKVMRIIPEFLGKHTRNFGKRIFYNYFLRDMSLASLELVLGMSTMTFGLAFGGYHWAQALKTGLPTALGIIMLAALPVLMGLQLLLAFLAYDIASVPRSAISRDLPLPESLQYASQGEQPC